ncbi:MAG TPA: ATP-binding protein [Acetobacteraceae bacterium]|nr:ATP-binding protein [Acetobacteraceae bacterium]
MNESRPPFTWPDDEPALRGALRPGIWGVERDLLPPAWHTPALLLAAGAEQCLALSLRTASAYRQLPLPTLLAALNAAGIRLAAKTVLALHELVVNAIVHGNLGIDSGPSHSLADLHARDASIKAALRDPAHANRTVTLAFASAAEQVEAAVADEGNGFVMAAGGGECSGRGLAIARAAARDVRFTAGGRCARLALRRMPEPVIC